MADGDPQGDKTFDTYTLKLKVRKTGGPNAFMIPAAIKDHRTTCRVHIGAWWNKVSAFELVADADGCDGNTTCQAGAAH